MPDRSTRGARLERTQHEEDGRDPLDRNRRHPGHAGELAPACCGQRQRTEHEGHHERVVVPAAGEVNGQERVPADERRSEGAAAGEERGEHGQRDHRGGRDPAEGPGCSAVRLARSQGDRLGPECEAWPVDGRRVTPVGAHALVGGILREGLGSRPVRVLVVHGGDPAVRPVRVDVRGEQHGPCERGRLDQHRHHDDRDDGSGASRERSQAGKVDGEGGRRGAEIEPGPAAVAAAVIGRERRAPRMRRGDCDGQEDERADPGCERGRGHRAA